MQISIPHHLRNDPRLRWLGSVTRNEANKFYQDADLLVFPTLSDGFGLTQLEAQAWSLPIIASQFCGDVVRNGVNGIVLDELSPDAISAALRSCLREPERLCALALNAITGDQFSLKAAAKNLLGLFESSARTSE